MKIARYAVFCIVVLVASVLVRRPAGLLDRGSGNDPTVGQDITTETSDTKRTGGAVDRGALDGEDNEEDGSEDEDDDEEDIEYDDDDDDE